METEHSLPHVEKRLQVRSPACTSAANVRAIVVVEGQHDMTFLRSISAMLAGSGVSVPHLGELEHAGHLLFLPVGGGDITAWTDRLAPLGKSEFHLYDRELSPETERREQLVDRINRRTGCQAVLTSKRSLENYLHPRAVAAAGSFQLEFDDYAPVATLLAERWQQAMSPDAGSWSSLTTRARKRLACRAKRWLNSRAVMHMTTALLAERDPAGEIISWLRTIQRMVKGP